jgi:hypothetical protein
VKKFKTHICLVNENAMENILPLLDPNIAPEQVILCYSPSHKKDAEMQRDFCLSKGLAVEMLALSQKHQLACLQESFLQVHVKPSECALNLSCGSKLMCLAAYEFLDDEIFRFCVEKDHLYPISDPGTFDYYDLDNQIKLEDYFALHGWEVQSLVRTKTVLHDELMDELFERVHDFEKAIGLLNKLANDADDDGVLNMRHRRKFNESQLELMGKLYATNLLSYYDANSVTFVDQEAVDFCRGFWIEDAAYLAMKKLKVQDCAISVEIRNEQGIKNEIDAAFLHENQLYLMECKTAHLAREGKGTQTLYKMDTLVDYAGLHTKGILASYRPLEDFDLRRAQDLNISIIQGTALKNFSSHLKKITEDV